MPINLVVGSQIAIRGLAVACVFDFDLVGQKSNNPNGRGYKIVDSAGR